jgi:WD40 repeat protein
MTEESLFLAALERTDPAERQVFLDQACAGDAELRQRIERLLAAYAVGQDKLEPPAPAPVPTVDYHPTAGPGDVIAGRYQLLERIGEGGMGEVWVAKQTEPVNRKVALKLIKPGMDSKAVLARFEQERQALALMDHPSIARVFDGGLTADGRPFFVMELVNGLPLAKFCDDAKLTPRERLELFVPVCQAVQHAHQKGIVHRDLKPSNVLVTLYDGKPVPKVIDFGLAKAIGGKLTDESLSTQFGSVVGTLEYMAPEQAGFSALDIDTRADIYALGVILYELLTGLRPFDSKRLRKAAVDEAVRIIREEEPPRPSMRLSTDQSLPSLAALRQTEPKRLMALMRGELDWVVMKCLEKDRNRRYETANGLARDIQRYLHNDPVDARPPSAGYRVRKFLRRNKGPALAAGAMAVLLVLGSAVSTWQAVRATKAEGVAEVRREEAVQAEQQARDERDTAEKERRRAETNEAKAQHSLYIANMNRVRFEMEHNNVEPARKLLDLYRQPETPEKDPRGWEWYYWDRMCQGELHTLKGHQGTVTAVAFSPDGSRLASAGGSGDATIKLWHTVTGQELWVQAVPKGQYGKIAFRPDGRILASGTAAGVTFWDGATGKELRTLTPEGKAVFGPVAFSPDWKTLAVSVTEGGSRSIKFWDLHREKWLENIPQSTVTTGLQYSPDGKILAQMHREGVNLWDVTRCAVLHTFADHQFTSYSTPTNVAFGIAGLAFSPDGRILATCGWDGTAKLRDITSGRTLHTLTALFSLQDLTFSTEGKSVITVGDQGFLTSWEVRTGRKLRSYFGHSGSIQCVSISPDGTRVASGDSSGEIKQWDALGSPTQRLSVGRWTMSGPTFSPDGKMLAYNYWRGVEVRDVAQARPGSLLLHRGYDEDLGGGSGVTSRAFSPDSRMLATACWRSDRESRQTTYEIRLWNLESGRMDRSFQGFKEFITQLVFSPDGKTLAFTTRPVESGRSNEMTVKLWDLTTGKEQQSFSATGMAFSPDAQTLALVGRDRQTLRLIDRSHGRDLWTLKGRGGPGGVSFSPEGERLFFGGSVWEVASGREICRLEGNDPIAYFSLDGRRLFSATSTPTARAILRVWDAGTGDLLLAVDVPGALLAVRPDGWQCAVASGDFEPTWLVDARPLTLELRQRHEAENLVAHLFQKPLFKQEVLAFLHELKTISEPVRREALALAQQQEHDPDLLNGRSADILIHSDRTPEEYRKALKWAAEAHRLEPEAGPTANTYGIALYYVGRYEEAIAALERSRQLNLRASQSNHYVYDLLFLAMAQWKSGRHEEAKATLQRARDPKLPQHEVLPSHWREAEALIDGKPNEPNK